jgi:nicotinate-nucleotide--dimethylbenzimidazole phosphoribosyltransferase
VGTRVSEVVRHVVSSIGAASRAQAEAARARVAGANAGVLERLAAQLAGAQHTSVPRADRRTIVVVAGDHGAGDPGIALGPSHPTVIAAIAIADGSAALAGVARASRAPIVIVDAGAVESAAMPASVIQLGRGPTRDLLREPAMTVIDATLGLEAGIALAMSLSEQGLDVLALGALGLGSDLAAAALLGALGAPEPAEVEAWGHGRSFERSTGLEILAAVGGAETAVLAGLILGAASVNTPIVLDGHATGAAAAIAAKLAPPVTGYLIAAHAGSALQAAFLERLGLEPVFAVGLGHGEGIGAAMVLPLIDQVTTLVAPR